MTGSGVRQVREEQTAGRGGTASAWWSQGAVPATAEGVDSDGALRLRLDDGTLAAAVVGDVTFC